MKKIIAILLALAMLATFFVACDAEKEPEDTTTTTTKKTTTLPPAPGPDDEDPEIPAETPVTGEEFEAWHTSKNTVQIINTTSDGISFYNDTTETLASLTDGLDGFFTGTGEGEWTKMGGGATAGCYVTFEVPAETKVSAYAFVTGNDSALYAGRTPGEWNFYGSNVAPDAATDEDWVLLDYVYDGATQDVDFTPFGYTLDEDKVGAYQYYKIEFLFGITGSLGAIQLCEFWLYTEVEG